MKTLLIPAGNKTVAAALRDAGYSPALPCGGRQSCGKCVVWVKGSFCAVSPEERALLDQAVPELPQPGFVRRLACFCRAEGAGGAVLLPNQAEPPVTAAFDTSLLSYDGEDPFSLGAVIDIGTTTISLVLLRMADAA
ncbi:MAG: hypothetical protein LBQ33_05700, partial [Oscillospiraceae bacterium]|nr:hypothetical protein [Oscillospiraceae bacterium]